MSGVLLVNESGEVLLGAGGDALGFDTANTRLGSAGYGVRRAGSFGAKFGTDGPHLVGRITRLGSEGYGVRRCGSFAGKPASADSPHTVGRITRLGSAGYGVKRCGSFAGKTAGAGTHPVGKITRLGSAGYGVKRCGPFAGKTSATPTTAGEKSRALRNVERGEHGLATEAEHRAIALRREKQERIAALVMLREQIEETKRLEAEALARIEPPAKDLPAPRRASRKRKAPLLRPDPAIEVEQDRIRVQAKAKADQLEAAVLKEIDDIRRLEANLLRLQLEDEDEEDALLLLTMMM